MIYSKIYISNLSNETSFIKDNIEKVIRLLDVLKFIFSESSFKDKLVLKGGTAINLAYSNLKRLSVDIDLDYHGSLDKKTVIKDRKKLVNELDIYMIGEGYTASEKSRGSVALLSRMYKYTNCSNNVDYIKIEINFMNRIYIFPLTTTTFSYFDKTIQVVLPAKEELFGMKISALIDRSKPRDLYDSLYVLANIHCFNNTMLRKATIFYLALDGIFRFDKMLFENIKNITNRDIKRELRPVLKKKEEFILEKSINSMVEFLEDILNLSEEEKRFVIEFSKGNFLPSLLFDLSTAEKIKKHPMALWKINKIKNS